MKKRFLIPALIPIASVCSIVSCGSTWETLSNDKAIEIAAEINKTIGEWYESSLPSQTLKIHSKSKTENIHGYSTLTTEDIFEDEIDLKSRYLKLNKKRIMRQNGGMVSTQAINYHTYDETLKTLYELFFVNKRGYKKTGVESATAVESLVKTARERYFDGYINKAYESLINFSVYVDKCEELHNHYKNDNKYYFNYSFKSNKPGNLKILIDCYIDQDILGSLGASTFKDKSLKLEIRFNNNLISYYKYNGSKNFISDDGMDVINKQFVESNFEYECSVNKDNININDYSFGN